MKNILILIVSFLSLEAFATCTSPISRTNNGTNAVLTSTKYNADLNTAYNKINALPGDCITDETISGAKLIATTVTASKLASDSVTTVKILDGSVTTAKLATGIETLVPTGTVSAFVGATAPAGYLLCNGQSLSRTTYATLYAIIGTKYGTADGNSFNIPDFRGRFLRMIDGGSSRDPDKASRTAMNTGGVTGDDLGTIQTSAYLSHSHLAVSTGSVTGSAPTSSNYVSYWWGSPSAGTNDYLLQGSNTAASTGKTSLVGGNETRPINASVNYIIKY